MRLIRGVNVKEGTRTQRAAGAMWLGGLLMLALASGCRPHQAEPAPQQTVDLNSGGDVGDGKTRVRVDNQNLADMTIYVYRGAQRLRLGRASGNGVTNLEIPKSMVAGMTELRFLAEPMAGRGGLVSQPVLVNPGDQVDFYVPVR